MFSKYLPTVMIAAIVVPLISAWAKLTHQPWVDNFMTVAIIVYFVSVVIGLMEVFKSEHIDNTEKVMWTVAFIFITTIGFICYVAFGRKRVIAGRPTVNRYDQNNLKDYKNI